MPPKAYHRPKEETEVSELEQKVLTMKAHAVPSKISEEKLQAFTKGNYKKNQFEKQKEAEEAKRKREEEDAAKVYEEFVASLEADKPVIGRFAPKAWVKGGTIQAKNVGEDASGPTKSEDGGFYKPQLRFGPKETTTNFESKEESVSTRPPPSSTGRKRQLDAFLEEMKQNQDRDAQRPKHDLPSQSMSRNNATFTSSSQPAFRQSGLYSDTPNSRPNQHGSHDQGDPNTTNLYVGNLNPSHDEEMVCRMFARFGPIASVKIMWPRTAEESSRNRNVGFVSFMNRADAQKAFEGMDGVDGLKIGWGKPVVIPPRPIFVLDTSRPQLSQLPFNAILPPLDKLAGRSSSKSFQPRPEVHVEIPENREILMLIHRTIERVLVHGPEFEALLMDREKRNEKFRFLFVNEVEIEDLSDSSVDSDDSDAVRRKAERQAATAKGTLSKRHRMKLEAMIRKLALSRLVIATVMVFCIDHADAADEIADTLARSLMIPGTPVFPNKIARLYLLSDVLSNSGSTVPNAWRFRNAIEKHLPAVFAHLGSVWKGIQSRLRAEQMRKMVFNVVTVWEKWMIFSWDFTESLRSVYLNAKSAAEKNAEATAAGDNLKKELDGQRKAGTGLYADGDGGDDGEDVDGEPIGGDDMDEDVDGAPLDGSASAAPIKSGGGWKSIDASSPTTITTTTLPPPNTSKPKTFSGFVTSFSAQPTPTKQEKTGTFSASVSSTPFSIPLKNKAGPKPGGAVASNADAKVDKTAQLAAMSIPLKAKAFVPAKVSNPTVHGGSTAKKPPPPPPGPPPKSAKIAPPGKSAASMKKTESKDDEDMFS
ncbi:U2 snRNP-associated SURP domain-containing protein [Phlyctochytrium planicorne]|nr:U2 snRNP-associated SURP domain-containing protein [Phlyctochytrium planicorne]